ncbi:MAG: aldehyde dehydrogenase family protein [Oscillospiraceae bacterium]
MYKQYLNGRMVDGLGKPFNVYNPATGETIDTVGAATAAQALEALDCAKAAFKKWSKETTMDERVAWLRKYFQAISAEKEHILDLLMSETGKPYETALEDWGHLVNNFNFYAEEIRRVYGVSLPSYNTPYGETYHIVEKRPLGVIVGHLAWNYPLLNASLKICPTIVSGCTCVLKPSSQTPLATLYLGEIAEKIGLPAGVVNILAGPAAELGHALNTSRIPSMITLIGSDETGRHIQMEGSSSIKRYSLELGGIAPLIVMEDADLDFAAKNIVTMKCSNTGQMCIDYNRIYIHESIYGTLCAKILEEVKKIKVGCGRDEGYVMGPLINRGSRDRMFELIDDALKGGAKLLYGGTVPRGYEAGNYIWPTLLVDVKDTMRVSNEEIFGPIIPLQPYSDYEKALQMAIDSDYGLTSYLFGHDARAIARAFEVFESGEVFVNGPGANSHLPHVGARQSGVGCDMSFWSLEEYFQLKRLSINP